MLVDSNVLLDVLTEDARWADWSSRTLAACGDEAPLLINQVVYAEVSIAFARIEQMEALVPAERFERESLPWEAGFLAGKCFVRYRRRGGVRRSPLPDFYIGAHAAVRSYRLLTRDPRRYRKYFPTVELISPARSS